MLQQDRVGNPAHFTPSTLNIGPRCEKDGNFNFLGPDDDDDDDDGGSTTGDENRNPVRPRPLTRDPSGPLSPLSRLPCWSPLEPLPEIESGDDMGGRVPPDGAEEEMEEEEKRREMEEEEMVEEKRREMEEEEMVEEKRREMEQVLEKELELEWADSEEEFEFSCRSESSLESGDIWEESQKAERRRESIGPAEHGSSDSDPGPEAIWTLQERERFKAQEMEKHQLQLIMYRRLALLRWVRGLQNRVQEQQNRLQSSFDIILTHRKELLRMGVAAPPPN